MTCLACDQDPCTCQPLPDPKPAMPPQHRYRPLHHGPMLTKEEFGLDLYEAVKTMGGMLGLDEQREYAIQHGQGHKLQGLLDRRRVLQDQLATILPKLSNQDCAEFLAQYPQVAAL